MTEKEVLEKIEEAAKDRRFFPLMGLRFAPICFVGVEG